MGKYPYIKKLNEEVSLVFVFFIFLCLFCYVFADDPLSPCHTGTSKKTGLLQIPSRIQEKPDAIWEVLQTKQDFTMIKPRTGKVDVGSERPSLELSLKSLFPRLRILIFEVMWPWRFRLYLDLERPIRMDDSTQSRQINGKGTCSKHNQLHSYILCGFFLLNFMGCVG